MISGLVIAAGISVAVFVHKANNACQDRINLELAKQQIGEVLESRTIDEAVRASSERELIERVYVMPIPAVR